MSSFPKLSIVTVTLNAAKHIPFLIKSLQDQTSKDFEWIIADGESKDETLELISKAAGINASVVSAPDFGIYDAMNRGIKRSSASHYIVIGADDIFEPDAIQNIIKHLAVDNEIDILVGQVKANHQLLQRKVNQSFIYGASAYITSHSVGSVIKKSLHDKYGFYSRFFPITADNFFIKTIFADPDLKVKYVEDVFGTFGTGGASNTQVLQCYVEGLHAQLLTEKYPLLQILIFTARYMKLRLFSKKVSP